MHAGQLQERSMQYLIVVLSTFKFAQFFTRYGTIYFIV